MKKSLIQMFGIVAVTCSMQASAAGIGGINVLSALGAPLSANIELVSVSKDEKSSLVARLATPEAYKSAGLDYPFSNKFKFTIDTRADGSLYLHATTTQPVNDPFVSLMVELKWASGRVLREYTFLLDPPGYQPAETAAAPVQTVAPVAAPVVVAPVKAVAPTPVVAAPAPDEVAMTPIELEPETPAPAKAKSGKVRAAKPAVKQEAAAAVEPGDITVKSGDTLNKIAAANKVSGVSLERMMVALYRANTEQFEGQNMNRIKTGKVLRKPDEKSLQAVTQSDAKNEIHAQVSDWNSYRQRLASAAPTSSKPQAAQQVSSGKISSSVADKTPPVKENAKEVLKLSKGDAPTDKAAAGKTTSQDKKNAAQEEAIAKTKAAEEERIRQSLLEKNLQDMKHLAELKTQAAALAKPVSAPASAVVVAASKVPAAVVASQVAAVSSPVVASSVTSASQVANVSAVVAASPVAAVSAPKVVPKPVVKPPVAVVEESLVDQILGEPLYLAGGAAGLLGLGGLAVALRRRKSKPVVQADPLAEPDFSATGRIAAPEISSPETGDFTVHASSTQSLAPLTTEDDPISEADLFLSFGRDVQAEEILQEALQSSANKTPIRMKLLDIYAARKDAGAFEEIATQVKHSGDEKAWNKAEGMGCKLDPKNPLYGGVSQFEDSDSATMQTAVLSGKPDVSAKMPARPASFAAPAEPVFEPEMGATGKMIAAMASVSTASSVMDFDVGVSSPDAASHQEKQVSLDDLVFDITATHPPMPAASGAIAEANHAEDGMSFLMDFPSETSTSNANATTKMPEFNLSDINLDLGGDHAGVGSEQWQEVATKLDLAKAYDEMGDSAGAREILGEVLHEGDAEQRKAAQEILDKLA